MKPPEAYPVRVDHILVEQFLRKGYSLHEIEEPDATIFIFTHEKKCAHVLTHEEIGLPMQLTYKDLIKVS